MAQPISDYKSFFENAKQALNDADALGIEEERLKEEELEVLRLSAAGLTMTEIANKMCRSLDSIKTYKRHAFDKLGVANITEAISRATLNKLF